MFIYTINKAKEMETWKEVDHWDRLFLFAELCSVLQIYINFSECQRSTIQLRCNFTLIHKQLNHTCTELLM